VIAARYRRRFVNYIIAKEKYTSFFRIASLDPGMNRNNFISMWNVLLQCNIIGAVTQLVVCRPIPAADGKVKERISRRMLQ
jgi:hypothetical protein